MRAAQHPKLVGVNESFNLASHDRNPASDGKSVLPLSWSRTSSSAGCRSLPLVLVTWGKFAHWTGQSSVDTQSPLCA